MDGIYFHSQALPVRSYSDQSESALKVLSLHFLIGLSMSARVKPGNEAVILSVDTNGTYHFAQYSEVSLSQGLLMYMYIETNELVSIGTVDSVLYIVDVLNSEVSSDGCSTVVTLFPSDSSVELVWVW